MSDINTILKERLGKQGKENKATQLAERSASGELSTFSGLFRITPINAQEKDHIKDILSQYHKSSRNIQHDLEELSTLASELKSINNQAILLHGERIQKAQKLLTNYKDGAFTAWLIAIYGNRQTPYNFLQYFEFYHALPKALQEKIYTMPRQAIYTLASREGDIKDKQKVVESYNGESKEVFIEYIRKTFPLKHSDHRKPKIVGTTITTLSKLLAKIKENNFSPNDDEKTEIINLLNHLLFLTNSKSNPDIRS